MELFFLNHRFNFRVQDTEHRQKDTRFWKYRTFAWFSSISHSFLKCNFSFCFIFSVLLSFISFSFMSNILKVNFNRLWNSLNVILMPQYVLHKQTWPSERASACLVILNACNCVWFFKFKSYPWVLRMNWGGSARGRKLLCSPVVLQLIRLYCQTAAEQLAHNVTFYVGLANKLHLAVSLLLWRHNII